MGRNTFLKKIRIAECAYLEWYKILSNAVVCAHSPRAIAAMSGKTRV